MMKVFAQLAWGVGVALWLVAALLRVHLNLTTKRNIEITSLGEIFA